MNAFILNTAFIIYWEKANDKVKNLQMTRRIISFNKLFTHIRIFDLYLSEEVCVTLPPH